MRDSTSFGRSRALLPAAQRTALRRCSRRGAIDGEPGRVMICAGLAEHYNCEKHGHLAAGPHDDPAVIDRDAVAAVRSATTASRSGGCRRSACSRAGRRAAPAGGLDDMRGVRKSGCPMPRLMILRPCPPRLVPREPEKASPCPAAIPSFHCMSGSRSYVSERSLA